MTLVTESHNKMELIKKILVANITIERKGWENVNSLNGIDNTSIIISQ